MVQSLFEEASMKKCQSMQASGCRGLRGRRNGAGNEASLGCRKDSGQIREAGEVVDRKMLVYMGQQSPNPGRTRLETCEA